MRPTATLLPTLAIILAGCGGATDSAPAPPATAPGATGAPVGEEAAEDADEHFDRSNWDILASSPDNHKGATVEIVGKVFTAPERDDDGVYWQMWADPDNSEWNTIVAHRDPDFTVKSGDFVRVRGTVSDAFEGENAFGVKVTVPTVIAESVEVVDATAAASPASAVLDGAEQTTAGITVTVERVELADDETRVFLTVTNGSAASVSVYGHSAKIVQGGRQLEPEFATDYPDLSSDLLPGASTSGVIAFPPIESGVPVTLHLEGYSDDSDVGEYGSLTWTFEWAG